MPSTIAMATAKLSPMLPATSKPSSAFSSPSSLNSSSTSVSTISIPVSAFHDPSSNVITITPYIFVKTATVAEQMQALRQDKKIGKPPEQPAGALRVKRRTDLSKLGLPDAKPASVSRRNARERNRVKQVNLGFETLREHVPNGKKNKKMSKVQTLRSAAQYIKDLYMILHGELPALGSPNVIDENEPNSPIDNSICSVSDTDNDVSVGSPESNFHQFQIQQPQEHDQNLFMESQPVPESPVSSVFSQNDIQSPSQAQQEHVKPFVKLQGQSQQSLVLKKEQISVLQQQLSRGQLSQIGHLTNQVKYQQVQQHRQFEQQQQKQQQQHPQPQHEQLQHQLQTFSALALRLDPLTCTTILGMSNAKSVLDNSSSALTFTELSPVSLVDEQCDNFMDASSNENATQASNIITINNNVTTINNSGDNITMDITTSPSILQSFVNDVNMNVIGSKLTDFDALQNYYKSVHSEHFQNTESRVALEHAHNQNNNNFLIGQNSKDVHSPAPSLSSSTSSVSSDADICGNNQYDYDNLDREALLDISNWISELCSQGMHLTDTSHGQQTSLTYSN